MNKKLNPLQMVARELAEHIDMESDEIERGLVNLTMFLHDRAAAEIDKDVDSDEAAEAVKQYRIICEVIAFFGTQLIAFEDMEDELPRGSN
jgi:hypothetical protein